MLFNRALGKLSFSVFTSDQSIYLKAHALSVKTLLFETETKTQSKWVIGLASVNVIYLFILLFCL